MAVVSIEVEKFFLDFDQYPVIDVRSEGEFSHAHIPGAYSLPLFNNQERAVVGTAYKQQSRQQAIKLGLDIFGKKMVHMVEEIERLTAGSETLPVHANPDNEALLPAKESKKTVVLHCWRGGMRSAGVAWLLDLYGFKVLTIAGGYKAFRNWALQQFNNDYFIHILGGYTGSGKTFTLTQMKKSGALTIDLEALACHKGSAFGKIGMPGQPTQEMFENALAVELWYARKKVCSQQALQNTAIDTTNMAGYQNRIWLEDESQRIGNLNIPAGLWNTMRSAPLVFINIPFEQRLKHIVEGYGKGGKEELINAIIRIKKRLGGLQTKSAVNYLLEDDVENCFRILLTYYDRLYEKGLQKRAPGNNQIKTLHCDHINALSNAAEILKIYHTNE